MEDYFGSSSGVCISQGDSRDVWLYSEPMAVALSGEGQRLRNDTTTSRGLFTRSATTTTPSSAKTTTSPLESSTTTTSSSSTTMISSEASASSSRWTLDTPLCHQREQQDEHNDDKQEWRPVTQQRSCSLLLGDCNETWVDDKECSKPAATEKRRPRRRPSQREADRCLQTLQPTKKKPPCCTAALIDPTQAAQVARRLQQKIKLQCGAADLRPTTISAPSSLAPTTTNGSSSSIPRASNRMTSSRRVASYDHSSAASSESARRPHRRSSSSVTITAKCDRPAMPRPAKLERVTLSHGDRRILQRIRSSNSGIDADFSR